MAITIERQTGERGAGELSAAPAGQCCCCCCCCLHSVGGVIGAVSAVARPPAEPSLPVSALGDLTLEPRYSATGLYWAMVLLAGGLLGAYFTAFEDRSFDAQELALLVALCLPAVQLGGSLLALLVLLPSKRIGREVRLHHLGRITLRAFLGALIGIVLMLPLLGKC